jgi:tRNA(fMet)-specific endonuclease VapC
MAYIIDADWIIEITRGNQRVSGIVQDLANERVSVSWLTLGEVFEVAHNSSYPQARLDMFYQYVNQFDVVGVNGPIIERFAEIRSFLRRQGQLISDLDIVLAATALQLDLTVLTYNSRDFERIPDLRIYRAG